MDGERAGIHVADGVDQAHHPAGSAHVQAGQSTGLTERRQMEERVAGEDVRAIQEPAIQAAILLERGATFAQGRRKFETGLDAMLADAERLPPGRIRQLILDMREEWSALDRRIVALDEEFAVLARTDEAARRLTSIPGVGALNATALVAAVGRAESFDHARDLGAFLGLVPRQHSTGGKPRLLGISKRGNAYLRTLLIHGARAALPSLAKSETALGAWLRSLLARCHHNTVVVALANKLARIAWALLRREETFSIGRATMA